METDPREATERKPQSHRGTEDSLWLSLASTALSIELTLQGLSHQRQVPVPIIYKGHPLGDYRLDLLVEDTVVVEVKSVERYDPVFQAQVLTYLKSTGKRIGLLINFNTRLLHDGVKRISLCVSVSLCLCGVFAVAAAVARSPDE